MTFITLLEQFPIIWVVLVGLFSLPVGSFLNVVIHRFPTMLFREWKMEYHEFFELPLEEKTERYNLFLPHSHCPHCQKRLRAWHNIPIISYLFLRGRCAFCEKPISLRYPFVECLTAVLSMFVACHFGPTGAGVAAIFLTWGLVTMAFIDLDHLIIPDEMIYPLLWLGLICNLFAWFVPLREAVVGAIAGYLSLWSVMHLYKLITGKQGMGHGDFKLFALFGAWLGWQILPFIIVTASLLGAIVGFTWLSLKGADRGTPLPFGPYLVIAFWVALIWGEPIMNAYLEFMFLR